MFSMDLVLIKNKILKFYKIGLKVNASLMNMGIIKIRIIIVKNVLKNLKNVKITRLELNAKATIDRKIFQNAYV